MNLQQVRAIALVIFFFSLSSAEAQNIYAVKSIKASVLGSSTLHDWESEITQITCEAHFEMDHNIPKAIKNIRVEIPVKGIKSKEGELMDSKTYEAFKYEQNPTIIFEAADAEINFNAGIAVIKTTGNLTMAGTTRPIIVEANWKLLPNGDFEVEVSKNIKMTDFNMKPPTAILGTIHVGDQVTIKTKLVLTVKNH